jgi:hypothetical protein
MIAVLTQGPFVRGMSDLMTTVEGRNIYLVKGKGRSNTVNICDANNRRGQYDWIVRFIEPTPFVTEHEVEQFKTVRELVDNLERRGGIIEQKPPAEVPDSKPPIPDSELAYDHLKDPWIQEAKWHVEHALDQLVHEFVEFPYLHRVEQSLHARLFQMLSSQPHFSRLFPLRHNAAYSQTVHREWPEAKMRPTSTKRGNFDLAIIAPDQLQRTVIADFKDGRLAAPIAIEMGVDGSVTHLADDIEKLLNSEIPYAYLVHFLRESYLHPQCESLVLQPGGNVKITYVRLLRGEVFFKLLADDEIKSRAC